MRSSCTAGFVACACLLAVGATAGSGSEAGSVLSMSQMTFVGSSGSSNEMVVEAERARLRSNEGRVQLEQVHAQGAGGDGKLGFEMRCDSAELEIESTDFTATGNVRGRTGDGRRFETTWLRFDHVTNTVWTDAPVTIADAGGRFEGGGFRYHLREQRMVMSGGARVVQDP